MFGAVEDIVVALKPGGGLNRSRVRTRLRFGQAKGGEPFTGGEDGQMAAFLFLCSGDKNRKCAERRAGHGQGDTAAGPGELFRDQGHLRDAATHALVLLRDPETEKVHARHLADDGPGKFGAAVVFSRRRRDGTSRKFTRQLLKGCLHLGQIIVHHVFDFSCF